jgi:sodium/potassium/calcium exchanger 6
MDGQLIDFEEEGIERTLVAEDELKSEGVESSYNKWITAVQCILGPLFCVSIIIGLCSQSSRTQF